MLPSDYVAGQLASNSLPLDGCLLAEVNRLRTRDRSRTARLRRAAYRAAKATCCRLRGAALRIDTSLRGQHVSRVVRIGETRLIAGLFELNQFGAHLGAGGGLVGLRKRSDRSGQHSGNNNGLNERFHD